MSLGIRCNHASFPFSSLALPSCRLIVRYESEGHGSMAASRISEKEGTKLCRWWA